MNLAEIRKKAEGTKKTAPVVAADLPDEVEPGTVPPELELEPLAEESEAVAAAVNEAANLPDIPPVPEEFSLADEPGREAEPEVFRDVPAAKEMSRNEAPPAVAIAETSALPSAPRLAAPSRTGYDPLATILSGREEAVDSDDAAAFQQQLLSAGDIEEYLCFRVADEEYALNIMSIKEIIKPREVTEVPRMPDFISGVISLRGVIIPVMDMRLRLSLPVQGKTGRERIIVLRNEAGFCGVLVDEVVQVARIRKADIEDPPAVLEEIDRDFVNGLGHFDNRMLILLNLETITDISIH